MSSEPVQLDVTDLILVYTSLFANLTADLHAAGIIDGRQYAEALALDGDWSEQARGAMDYARERLLECIEKREARAAGPRFV